MKKIAVLMGGTSSEREVSLVSGTNVANALLGLGKYEVLSVDLKRDSLDALPEGVDAVYIALHGGWGENGGVQAALNALKIPYTGPGVIASRIAMDKIETKKALEKAGIPTAPWALASRETASSPLPLPVVVKPPCDGSSVGISKVTTADEWANKRDAALDEGGKGKNGKAKAQEDDVILVEAFVPGREFTVGIIDGECLPAIEIIAKGGWYGYDEKYRSNETRYEFLPASAAALEEKLASLARRAYDAIGCRGVTRVDFRVAGEDDAFVLELNTSPGFTPHSLVPKAGMRTGLSFAQVCDRILSTATFDR